jgi:UDP-glucuronate 4-epimerase
MTILVTGGAGFIGYHLCEALLARGETVISVDNLSPYYDVALKEARLARLERHSGFAILRLDISDREAMAAEFHDRADIDRVVHLAAQAGVRYSIDHPFAYLETNLTGHLVILELCRRLPALQHLVYASSSSVYGANTKLPFSVDDPVELPKSLYAATKRADELMSQCYAHLYRFPQTGLRFFTVYGPWGRPDMALCIFTKAIYAGEPIHVFNNGDMGRDFTYVDDIVAGTVAVLDHPPAVVADEVPHRVFNIGNNRVEHLSHLIELLEKAIGRKAELILEAMPAADVKETFADITPLQELIGFKPTHTIADGVPKFVAWYRDYHGL